MVTVRPVYFLYAGVLALIAALSAVAMVEHRRASDLRARLTAVVADGQRSAMQNSGAVVSKDVPAPPVPSQLRDRVDAVRRAVPEAKVERTEDVQTVWIEAQGPVLPCGQVPPHAAGDSPDAKGYERPLTSAPDGASGGALLRVGDRFRIRLVSVDLATPQGATGTVGEAELIRFDGASLGRGPLDQDASTVWRRQRPQERPRWFAMPMLGATSNARLFAGVAAGRGRWGGVLGAAWKPGDAEYFGGVAVRW